MIRGGSFGGHSAARGHADEEVFGAVYDQKVILRLLPYITPYKKMVGIAFFAMIIYTLTQVGVPWLIALGIDTALGVSSISVIGKGQSGLNMIIVVFFVVAILNWVSNYSQQFAMEKVGQGVLFNLRRGLFGHVQKQSLSYFDKTEVGRLMSRVQGDVGQLQEFSALVVMTLGELLSLVGIVVALLLLDLELGLITMTVIPVLTLIMVVWQRFARRSFIEVRRCIAIVNAAFNENISGVRVVLGLNRQNKNLKVFDDKNLDHRQSNILASRYTAGLMPSVDILTSMSICLALLFGASMVGLNGSENNDFIEPGVLVAFVMYIQRFFDPIRNLTMQYTQLQRSMASGARIFDLMDQEPEMKDDMNAGEMPSLNGKVEFSNVSFSYVPGEEVLSSFNMVVNPGETVALVGPTGAGKTSVISLLTRLYDYKDGDILVDGISINSVTRKSLISQMSVVLQDPYLFSGSVKENIKYENLHVSDGSVVAAAKTVGARQFVMNLPDGYDTLLTERGSNISLGERQLLSFARAIIADPRILILDEATANVDSYTEAQIQAALSGLLKDRTAIVIAHRLSTIRGADKIVVMDKGNVVEAGRHDDLITNSGLYSRLYEKNFSSLESDSEVRRV